MGNSTQFQTGVSLSAVHPRVCGELYPVPNWRVLVCGSSPRVWGTLLRDNQTDGNRRFIPACVGNSYSPLLYFHTITVHPRVCGELIAAVTPAVKRDGSSPRVWGTHFPVSLGSLFRRFIPACVGNSIRCLQKHLHNPVHPRVCGELSGGLDVVCNCDGSSPRVWGTLFAGVIRALPIRFIPACVGNS